MNNEPAFPSKVIELREFALQSGRNLVEVDYTGMTLRDYFAAQVMPTWAMVTNSKDCANRCYEYADAMLEARKQ